MKWVKFLKEWVQKAKDDKGEDKTFKEGDIIQVNEEIAKSLIELGLAEETKEPKEDPDLDPTLDKLSKSIEKIVETTISKGLDNVQKGIESKIPAMPKDHQKEAMRGFETDMHFYASVIAAGGGGSGPISNAMTKALGIENKHLELLTKAPSGQNISSDVDGGFLVPEPIANAIWTNMEESPDSIIARTTRYTTAGNSMKIPRIFESSRQAGTGKRFGGIQTAWLDEAAQLTSTQFTTGRENMELHKLGAVIYFTEEQLDDEGFDSESFARTWIPQAINFAVGDSYINGNGVGKPLGVLNADALIVIASGARDGSAQSNHTILHWNVNQMYWRNINRSRAVWYCHPDTAQQLEFMTFDDDTSSPKNPVYFPANLTNTPFATLYGRPVIPYEFMPDFGLQGDIIFVDWGGYATLTKAGRTGGVKVARSIHVRFLFEEVALRFTFRIDGRPLWTGPKEDFKGDTTRSPFVAMGKRTGGTSSSGL